MRVLVALGGNALVAADGRARPEDQVAAVRTAADRVADVVARGEEVILTHGNGPQVGDLLLKNDVAAADVAPVPLDWCVAQTQATIGLITVDALEHALAARGVRRGVCALITRTLVDADDPNFPRPSKPIGRYLPAAEAEALMARGEHWEDRGEKGWRRVVASPEPLEILDRQAVTTLVGAGLLVIANGGGGIPCVREPDGSLRGVEAVIDKDLGAALLAATVEAHVLVLATDVEHALLSYGRPDERPLHRVGVEELRSYAAAGHFASGSMGPKVEAVCRFVERGGTRGVITSLDRIADAVHGKAGTVVEPE